MKRILTPFFVLLAFAAFSQSRQFFYGADGKDLFQQVVPAPDGNYYLLGSKTDGVPKVWLLKINPDADIIWEKIYPSSMAGVGEYGHRLSILPDGNLLITGQLYYNNAFDDGVAMALKTDANGNQIWKQTYAGTTAAFDAVPSGNNFLLVGWNDNTGATNSGLLMLVNASGILQWKITVSVASQAYVKRIFPTADGNFLLAGRANVIGVGFEGIFLRKVAPNGDQIWQILHDTGFSEEDNFPQSGDFYTESLGAVQVSDGSIWIANPYQYNSDIALLHFSSDGVFLDEKIYGNDTWREYPYALTLLPDGGWLIAGAAKTNTNPADLSGFAMRTNANGLEIWRKYYGGENATERLLSGAPMPDGQFLLSGMSNSPTGGGSGNSDGWLLKTDPDGNILPWVVKGRVVIDTNGDCMANPGEPPASGWFVLAENDTQQFLITDADGNFTLNTTDVVTNFTVKPPTLPAWTICNNGQNVSSSSANPLANLSFVAQAANGGCPLTEISLTQPDLVRCDTSRFFATVSNRGLDESDPLSLAIQLDSDLNVVSASEPFTQSGAGISFQLQPLPGLQSKTIEIRVGLTCNVQIGESHPVVARISPLECAPSWSGPKYDVEGRCDGTAVRFDLKNSGAGGSGASTQYRVVADDLLAADWTQINLPQGAPAYILSFPADGRTWRVELEQAPGYPAASYPAAAVEGCGVGYNWLRSVSYLNTWRQNDEAPEVSVILPTNTTRVPNKIAESVHGLGLYNLHGDLRPLEFTARARNPLPHPTQQVSFRLSFSPTLDLSTFRVLSSNNVPTIVSLSEDKMINVVMENLQLDTGLSDQADALLRFVIHPFPGTPPDSSAASNFLVQGQAYFDNTGPFDLSPGFLNYSETFPVEVDEYNNYPPELQRFGARNYTFGTAMKQGDDGAVFLVGETLSYSERTNWDGLLVKTNPYGQVYWLNAIDLGDGGENTFRGVVPLSDGGCLAVGNYRQSGVPNYISNNYPYLARMDASGKLLWYKKVRPAGQESGAWTNGIQEMGDGNFVMFGHTQNTNSSSTDQFYLKFNAAGDVLWQRYEAIPGSAFEPVKAIQTPDGSLVFVGPNERNVFDTDVTLEKIDIDGNLVWNTSYLVEESDVYEHGIALAADDGIMFAGTIQWEYEPGEYGITPIFIKFSAVGELEWIKKPVVGPYGFAWPHQIISAPDGGFLVGGEIYADTLSTTDFMLLKIDENADTLWWRNYGAKNIEWVEDLVVSAPDQILLWGFNQSRPPLWDLRALLAHTDLEGNLYVDTKEQPIRTPHQTLVFPNPANYQANVVLSPQPTRPVDWVLFDVSGRVLKRGSSPTGLFPLAVDQLGAGIYVVAFPGSLYPAQRLVVVK